MTKKTRKARQAKQRKNNFSKGKLITVLLIIILFTAGISQIAYFFYSIRGAEIIDTRVQVSDKIGFAIGNKGMDFGSVPPGGSATREIGIVNQEKKEIKTRILFKGDIAKFIDAEDSNFILTGEETKQISVSVAIPSDAAYGNYTGKIIILFERP